jgi:hypothetical protein
MIIVMLMISSNQQRGWQIKEGQCNQGILHNNNKKKKITAASKYQFVSEVTSR